jgi:acrylyl-CoA reductase (NADPH)
MSFSALVTDKDAAGAVSSQVVTLDDARLPEGNVTVDVEWSGLNYKDGLCLTGAAGLVRTYPHVAGIDFAGTVSASDDARYAKGQKVILTGWRVGETHWGGYAQRARLDADWLVPLPEAMTTRTAMVLGTAGLTAMLAVGRLEAAGLTPEAGEVLVTGASGGAGSLAVMLLARLGYSVAVVSGRPELGEDLKRLGATTIISREDFVAGPDKPMESARWAGAVDAVGGAILGRLIKQVKPGGAIAAFGNAAGIEFTTSVLPFIMRGVSLIGVDSVMQPYAARVTAWQRLAEIFDAAAYEPLVTEIGLAGLPDAAKQVLAGKVHGRIIVKV